MFLLDKKELIEMENRSGRIKKQLFCLALLSIILLATGCIDITGKYAKELKERKAELHELKSLVASEMRILDKKERLTIELREVRKKSRLLAAHIARRMIK